MTPLVLSLFPGIGLLDMAFEEEGFCVVRGPDLLWGGDVHRFHPPAGKFDGVIGGPPCQAFSPLSFLNRAQGVEPKHGNLIPQFERIVYEAHARWFVMENHPNAPSPLIEGYATDRIVLENRWFGEKQARRRVFVVGGWWPEVPHVRANIHFEVFEHIDREPTVLASELTKGKPLGTRLRSPRKRSFSELCELQGLSGDFLKDAPFTVEGKCRVVGNGVPLAMGRAIAKAVKAAIESRAA